MQPRSLRDAGRREALEPLGDRRDQRRHVPGLAPHEADQRRHPELVVADRVLGQRPTAVGSGPGRSRSAARPRRRSWRRTAARARARSGRRPWRAAGSSARRVPVTRPPAVRRVRRPADRRTTTVSGLSRQSIRSPVSLDDEGDAFHQRRRCSRSSRAVRSSRRSMDCQSGGPRASRRASVIRQVGPGRQVEPGDGRHVGSGGREPASRPAPGFPAVCGSAGVARHGRERPAAQSVRPSEPVGGPASAGRSGPPRGVAADVSATAASAARIRAAGSAASAVPDPADRARAATRVGRPVGIGATARSVIGVVVPRLPRRWRRCRCRPSSPRGVSRAAPTWPGGSPSGSLDLVGDAVASVPIPGGGSRDRRRRPAFQRRR